MILGKGDKAPAFELYDQNNNLVRLSDFEGQKLFLYFYPKALTSGCTLQSASVRDASAELNGLKTAIVGISADTPSLQKKFDEKNNLGFPLLSDKEHKTAEKYGVWQIKKLAGKKFPGIVRSSFLIDEKGNIMETWYKISPKDTVPKVLETLSRK